MAPTAFRSLYTTNRLQTLQETDLKLLPFTANNLWDNPGARRFAKRVGRGPGSGLGKTSGKGHKGTYARAGGTIPLGFEGGQNPLHRRFPKFGQQKNRFNNGENFEQLNLGKLAYHIEKGSVDTTKPIQMKDLLDAGVISKVQDGVKILAKGVERFKSLGVALDIEVSDASKIAVEAIKELGGSVSHQYRTELLMRAHLKPHKFDDRHEIKTPMPPNKSLKKLERLKVKGFEVTYPSAPWFTDNYEKHAADRADKKKRIREGANHEMLPVYPAPRIPYMSEDKPRIARDQLVYKFKFPTA